MRNLNLEIWDVLSLSGQQRALPEEKQFREGLLSYRA